MQAAIQAATAAVMLLKETDAGSASDTSAAKIRELRQPFFDWKAPDNYVEPLSFEIEVISIL